MSGEAYPVPTAEYDKDKDPSGWYKTFQEFDADGSDAVDLEEVQKMVESLGMVVKKDELGAMFNEADTDGSGEIDFEEFVAMMRKAEAKADGGLSALVARQKDSSKMEWRTDRMGEKITIANDVASRGGEGFAVAALSPWLPGDSSNKLNRGSVLLEVKVADTQTWAAEPFVWVGLIGRNFNPEDVHWNQNFVDMKNQKKNLVTAFRSTDGLIYRNGDNLTDNIGLKARKFGCAKSLRIQMDLNADDKEVTFKILDETDDFAEVSKVTIDELKAEVCVGVCFGPTPCDALRWIAVDNVSGLEKLDNAALATALASKTEFTPDEFKAFNVTGLRHTHYVQSTGGGKFSPAAGAETTVRLVGSSCQKVAQRVRRSSKDLWDDDNKAGVNDKMTGGVGMEELF